MARYRDLPEPVRAIVDANARKAAKTGRWTLREARELIAAGVQTTAVRPTQGTGH